MKEQRFRRVVQGETDVMAENRQAFYRMNKLMRYTELEAFSAQKNAGSKGAYFELLSEFASTAPTIAAELATLIEKGETDLFLKKIFELQKQMLAIGAAPLLWDAEKVAEMARTGKMLECARKNFILVSKIKTLCAKLNEARADTSASEVQRPESSDTTMMTTDTAVFSLAMNPTSPDRPKAQVGANTFGKLAQYVRAFERDDALKLLESLMGSSYSNAIDSALTAIHDNLLHFDHEGAAAEVQRLLELAEEVQSDEEKATRKKILAVDDVPDVLNTVKAVLKDKYTVYGVTNHMAALKFLTNNSADLILLDIEMPDLDGFSLLGIIRKIKAYEKTPVLFLTGSVTVENIIKSRNAGGNDFLKKPIDAQVLLTKISKHLE